MTATTQTEATPPGTPKPATIQNPRRVPRALARCEARCLLPGGGFWAAGTLDFGPHGCQLFAPRPYRRGEPVKLVLTNERLDGELPVAGTVAWAANKEPWHLGVAFDGPFLPAATRWFDELARAYPGLATFGASPRELAFTETLRLGPVPQVAPELNAADARVLRELGAGVTVGELRERLAASWAVIEGPLFALVGRGLITLDAAQAGTPAGWAPILSRF
jgi:hypothetical protein